MGEKRAVVVWTAGGQLVAVGPVFNDVTVDELRAEVAERGGHVEATVPLSSAAAWRSERRSA